MKKIAFLFLVTNDLYQSVIWNAYFKAAKQQQYNIYVHSKEAELIIIHNMHISVWYKQLYNCYNIHYNMMQTILNRCINDYYKRLIMHTTKHVSKSYRIV